MSFFLSSAMVFDLIITDFDISFAGGDKFSIQKVVEPSIGYWA